MEVRSIEAIVRALNGAKVKYLIVGGLAVVAHGYERLTNDVDLVISLKRQNIIRGLRALIDIGYNLKIPVTPEQFADPRQLWSDVHRRTPVDVFVYEPFDFQREFPRALREPVFGKVPAFIVSYETLLQMKQSAGRGQDLVDIDKLRRLDPHRE